MDQHFLVELVAEYEDTRAVHFADTGLFIYATPNVQFDVRIGRRV